MSRPALLLVVVALGALRDPCGTNTTLVGVNAPCQRSTDCNKGLSCVAGMCAPPDGGPDSDDGGFRDAEPSDAHGSREN